MGLTWKEKLTLENLEDFATEFIKPTYLMAYKATLSEMQAAGISVDALSKVFALREYYEESGEDVVPEKAIANAMEPLLSKAQFANLHNPSITPDDSALPSAEALIELVDKVVDKANSEMPRYAPVYSGTTGVVVILAMVLVIVAAIAFICINPFGRSGDERPEDSGVIMVDSTSQLNPDYMVGLSAEVEKSSSAGYDFNSGTLPFTVEISGPDRINTEYLSATDAAGASIGLYQYEKNKYCCIALNEGVYRVAAYSVDGHASYTYVSVIDMPVLSGSDIVLIDNYGAVSHGQQTTIELFDSPLFDSCEMVSAADFVSASDLNPGEMLIIKPEYGTLEIDSRNAVLEYTADEHAGLDSITLFCCTDDGTVVNYTLPLVVSNFAPRVDTSALSLSLTHTPSKAGAGAGRLIASDQDGDDITFKLVNSINCSVMLAPNGSYLVSVDKDHSGSTASFSFTVTDGLITTDAFTVNIELKNNILTQLEYSQEFTCYAGDYFYTLALPQYDDDGDPLVWTVISPLQDGLTQLGSRVIVGNGSDVKYQISPDLNEDSVEVISLLCSDGWAQSPTVTMLCTISENLPPKSGGGNRITIPLDQSSVTCTLNIEDDFELDKCVIDRVYREVGGSVEENTGWDELIFTFTPDGTETDCYVILTVRDILTDATVNIRYNITRADELSN